MPTSQAQQVALTAMSNESSSDTDWLSALHSTSPRPSSLSSYIVVEKQSRNQELLLQALGEIETQRDESINIAIDLSAQLQAVTAVLDELLTSNRNIQPDPVRPYPQAVPAGARASTVPLTWLRGSWLAYGGVLAEAEGEYERGQNTKALMFLQCLLQSATTDTEVRINAMLLKAKVLEGTDMQHAGTLIEDAESLAVVHGLYELRRKVLFHRGINYFKCSEFTKARLAFAGATGADQYEDEISVWKELTKAEMVGAGFEDGSVVGQA